MTISRNLQQKRCYLVVTILSSFNLLFYSNMIIHEKKYYRMNLSLFLHLPIKLIFTYLSAIYRVWQTFSMFFFFCIHLCLETWQNVELALYKMHHWILSKHLFVLVEKNRTEHFYRSHSVIILTTSTSCVFYFNTSFFLCKSVFCD